METCIIIIIIIIIIIYPSSYSINIRKHALIMVATREKLHHTVPSKTSTPHCAKQPWTIHESNHYSAGIF
jgi:hypothetical protein